VQKLPPKAAKEFSGKANGRNTVKEKNTILVADDNADIQIVLGILLRGAGFNTVSAFDGQAAVALAEQTQPDLVLMDIALPRMDGLAATRQIRQLQGLEQVPIVGCSAYEPEDDERSQQAYAQMNAFLRKPTDFSTLLSVMQQLLRPIPTGQRLGTPMESLGQYALMTSLAA
jgi:CheY-like chemotaxis protein